MPDPDLLATDGETLALLHPFHNPSGLITETTGPRRPIKIA